MQKAILSLVLFVAVQIVTYLAALLWDNRQVLGQANAPDLSTLSAHPTTISHALLIGSLLTIALLFLMGIARKDSLIPHRGDNSKSYSWAIGAFLCMAYGLNLLLSPFELADNGSTAFFEAQKNDFLCLLLLCIVGPVTEEFIFREGILRALAEKMLSPMMATMTSAAVFMVVHDNLAQAVPAAILGFILGLLYIRTRHLLLCSTAHIANNSLAVALMFIPKENQPTELLTAPIAIVAGTLLFAIGCGLFYTWWKKYPALPTKETTSFPS